MDPVFVSGHARTSVVQWIPATSNPAAVASPSASRQHQTADGWEIPSNSIVLEEELGEGCFGKVHKGVVRGPILHSRTMKSSICRVVAVKFLKGG